MLTVFQFDFKMSDSLSCLDASIESLLRGFVWGGCFGAVFRPKWPSIPALIGAGGLWAFSSSLSSSLLGRMCLTSEGSNNDNFSNNFSSLLNPLLSGLYSGTLTGMFLRLPAGKVALAGVGSAGFLSCFQVIQLLESSEGMLECREAKFEGHLVTLTREVEKDTNSRFQSSESDLTRTGTSSASLRSESDSRTGTGSSICPKTSGSICL